ncbi:MAG: low molecular weight phosphatase family protein [Mycobacterium kyogaense]
MNILFVCTGNICRSPTAERLTAAYAKEHVLADLAASSAGIRAVVGHPVHREAARVLRRLGGDPSNFVARQLKPPMGDSADLVLTMTVAHREAVLERAPRLLRRTFTLSEASRLAQEAGAQTIADFPRLRSRLLAHETTDVADPMGQPEEVFEAVGTHIAALLRPLVVFLSRPPV